MSEPSLVQAIRTKIGRTISLNWVIGLAAVVLACFLVLTGLGSNPFILFGVGIFILLPFRPHSFLVKRLVVLSVITFVLWLLVELGSSLIPFVVSFLVGYLLDPVISWLERRKMARWLASLLVLGFIAAVITVVSVFVFPVVFTQLDDAIKRVSSLVTQATTFLESRKFYRMLASYGLPEDTLKEIVQNEFMPRISALFTTVMNALLSLLAGVSGIATQLVNIIIVPILSFYFVKDLPKLKKVLRSILETRNKKLLHDLQRISDIAKTYIGWQLIAATWIGTALSIIFTFFQVPYAIVIGVLCGILNPIPFVGSIASMVIGSVISLLVHPEGAVQDIIVIVSVINGIHFINAYLVEPRVLGNSVGLHPVLLIASLYVFGHFFGFIGLVIAVPTTAVLMMYMRDWQTAHSQEYQFTDDVIVPDVTSHETKPVSEIRTTDASRASDGSER